MKSLSVINFHCDDDTLTHREMLDSTHVDYIFSCVLGMNDAKTKDASKLNLYISRDSLPWSMYTKNSIVHAKISLNSSVKQSFELELANAVYRALCHLENTQALTVSAAEILNQVLSTKFKYKFYGAKRIPHSKGLKLRVDIAQGSTALSVETKSGKVTHLATLWPSPWLFLISHLGQAYSDGILSVDFRHSKVINPLFPMDYVDPSKCSLAWTRSLVNDARGRVVERLSFKIPNEA